jgi:hypothetical protein
MAENDGPIGAASLARAVYLALEAIPVLVCEEPMTPVLRSCARAAGFTVATFEEISTAKASPHAIQGRPIPAAVVQGFPADEEKAEVDAENILAKKPAALISIERMGANSKGVYHYGRGEANIREIISKVEILFERAKLKNVLTVGIGDGGNELGMGRIKDFVRENVPFGAKCQCPCGSGLAPEFEPDFLIAATVSNWGAYGVEACLAAIKDDLHILHSSEMEFDLIRACMEAGAVDGVSAAVEAEVDTLPTKIHAAIVDILHAIVKKGLRPAAIFRK